MNVGNVYIQFVPGSTYEEAAADPEQPKKSKAEARADAIGQFKKSAQQAILPNIHKAAEQLLALLIQYRALDGTMAGSPIPDQLREAADFMEDL